MSNRIDSNYTAFFSINIKPDLEWQRIIEKLWRVYGVRSSGSKSLDKSKLHELELRDAKKQAAATNKYLTISKKELDEIISKKNEKKTEEQIIKEPAIGAQILGEQIFLAINMKKEEDNSENKKKRNNKYQI